MHIAAILLAAGSSRRFGDRNKLLAEIDGERLIVRAVRALMESRIDTAIAVTPGGDPEAADAIAGEIAEAAATRWPGVERARPLPLVLVENPEPSRGIGSSIACGVRALAARSDGAMIVPGDMPGLDGPMLDRLIDAFEASGGRAVVHAASADGEQRNPVIWPRRLFGALATLDGDTGGKPLIGRERMIDPGRVVAVAFVDERRLDDVDRPDDLARWR